jgi:hypothetical protein
MLPLLIRTALAIALTTVVLPDHCLIAADDIANVNGKVTVNGRPLPEGKILLHADGVAPIEISVTDGAYSAEKVPSGERTVTIEGKGVPGKYSARETTPLKVAIRAGANEINFELKR